MKVNKKITCLFVVLLLLLVATVLVYFAYTSKLYRKSSADDTIIEIDGVNYYKYEENQWVIHDENQYNYLIGFNGGIRWRIYGKEKGNENKFILVKYRRFLSGYKPLSTMYIREDIDIEPPSFYNTSAAFFWFNKTYSDTSNHKSYETNNSEELRILLGVLERGEDIREQNTISYICHIDFMHKNGELSYPTQIYKTESGYVLITIPDNKEIEIPKKIEDQILQFWEE